MARAALAIVLLSAIALMTLPFVVSSLYIDRRGVTIPGHVFHKTESVSLRYSSMYRRTHITVEYSKPDGSGVGFLDVPLSETEYDATHVGQPVSLHYLRPEDLPELPLTKFLRGLQLLPTVHLATKGTFSSMPLLVTPALIRAAEVVGAIFVLLLVWRMARIPGFRWAVAVCLVTGAGVLWMADYPEPMPPPTAGVRHAVGRVQYIREITRPYGSRRRSSKLTQPIQLVEVEFVPEGRTDAVLAVDLINAKSVPGLHEKGSVPLTYESASPRTAYIDGATRDFGPRNIRGMGIQTVGAVAVLIMFVGVLYLFGRIYTRLVRRVSS